MAADAAHTPSSGQTEGERELARLFALQKAAYAAAPYPSHEERMANLDRIIRLTETNEEAFIAAIGADFGARARQETVIAEIVVTVSGAKLAKKHLKKWMQPRGVATPLHMLPGRSRIEPQPLGVVGIISPWNYPFTMALCDGLPALLAGNAVVAKPDAQTMLSALLGAQLLEEAGFPKDLWQVVAGPGSRVGTSVIGKADYICFTGSTATGKKVAAGCAERLIGCSLELGGKNPMLVLRDADVERAAEGAVRASFSNAGQLCVSMERLFVADQVYDRFRERFVARTQAMTLGATLDWGNDMGSLISQDQLDTVTRHVEDAVAKGARVLCGGRARPDLGPFYFEPTILEGVTPDMTCFGEETFGPVISLYRFHDEADAVARANDGEYGLNASIYSRDGARARDLARQVKCGTVNINEAFGATFASIDSPMGGMRESGMGRRQGSEGIHRYTESQSVGQQKLIRFAPMLGMSDEQYAGVMTANLRLMKKLGRA